VCFAEVNSIGHVTFVAGCRMAKRHRMPYLDRFLSAKEPYNYWLFCKKRPASHGILCIFATLYTTFCFGMILHPQVCDAVGLYCMFLAHVPSHDMGLGFHFRWYETCHFVWYEICHCMSYETTCARDMQNRPTPSLWHISFHNTTDGGDGTDTHHNYQTFNKFSRESP